MVLLHMRGVELARTAVHHPALVWEHTLGAVVPTVHLILDGFTQVLDLCSTDLPHFGNITLPSEHVPDFSFDQMEADTIIFSLCAALLDPGYE